MRTRLIIGLACVLALAVAIPAALAATTGGDRGRLDTQRLKFRVGDITTSRKGFRDITALRDLLVCAKGAVSVSVSVTVEGGPLALRVQLDDGPKLEPGEARFAASPTTTSYSYTWADGVGTFEGSDGHVFDVQWRSPSGAPVTLHRGDVVVCYQEGNCP